jgi:hypothetical protein
MPLDIAPGCLSMVKNWCFPIQSFPGLRWQRFSRSRTCCVRPQTIFFGRSQMLIRLSSRYATLKGFPRGPRALSNPAIRLTHLLQCSEPTVTWNPQLFAGRRWPVLVESRNRIQKIPDRSLPQEPEKRTTARQFDFATETTQLDPSQRAHLLFPAAIHRQTLLMARQDASRGLLHSALKFKKVRFSAWLCRRQEGRGIELSNDSAVTG